MFNKDNLFIFFVGLLFFIVGLILLNRYLKKKRSLSSPYSILVEGVVISCDAVSNSNDNGSMYSYYPVYEFYINGEKNIYRSKYGSGRDKTGCKQMLYYNT